MKASNFLLNIHTDTKKEEQEIVEQFFQRLEYTVYELHSTECPDFIAKIDNKKIGIEVTKYYSDFSKKGSKMQKNLIEWKNFALSLKYKLENTDKELSKVYGAIHFKESKFDFKLLLNDEYYTELINCIHISEVLKKKNSMIEISETEFPFLSKYIIRIYLEYTVDTSDFLWWDARLQSGYIVHNENAELNIVSKKEKAAKGYSNEFDQKWLIIFAEGLGLADIYSEYKNESIRHRKVFLTSMNEEEYKPKMFSTLSDYFTHIYIWDKFHEKIFQVAPYYKKIFDYGEGKIWINHLPIKQIEI